MAFQRSLFEVHRSALPVSQWFFFFFLVCTDRSFPAVPSALWFLNQWGPPLSVESLLTGVLFSWHPPGRLLCFFFLFFLSSSGCSAAPLSLFACWYYTAVTHTLLPFPFFFFEAHIPLSERDLSRASFFFPQHMPCLCTHRDWGSPFSPISVTLGAECSVTVFLGEVTCSTFSSRLLLKWLDQVHGTWKKDQKRR